MLDESEYKETCIRTIWHLEAQGKGSFNQYNAIKGLWRLGQKTEDLKEDVEKIIEYLEWEIDYLEKTLKELKLQYIKPFCIMLKITINYYRLSYN